MVGVEIEHILVRSDQTGIFLIPVFGFLSVARFLLNLSIMKNYFKILFYFFFVLGFVSALFAPAVSGAETDQTEILELINAIRLDPFARAEALGYDRTVLAQTLPWLKQSYEPYEMDAFLSLRAVAHNSLEGELPEPELSAVHDYMRTGETGGVVSFFNFLPPAIASGIIIDNLFRSELDGASTRYILSDEFHFIGPALMGGRLDADGIGQNAYFVTICFGSTQLKSEVQVLTMVNQVRSQPSCVFAYSGVSLIDLLGNDLDLFSEWFRAYPPLMDSPVLRKSAQSYSKQWVSIGGDPSLSPNTTPLARALDMGYEGLTVAESVVIGVHPANETSAQLANSVFLSLVHEELNAVPERGGVFSLGTSDGGVGIAAVFVDDQVMSVASVLDAGVPTVDDAHQANIYGVVYFDNDENKIYSPGEGCGLASVVAFRKIGNISVKQTVTDIAGHFNMKLDRGERYRFEISSGDLTTSLEMRVDRNLFLPVELSLPPVYPQL